MLIDVAQLPSDMTTVEQLLVFAQTALIKSNNGRLVYEDADKTLLPYTLSVYPVVSDSDLVLRGIGRISTKIASNHASMPLWRAAEPDVDGSIPPEWYTS